MTTKVSQKYYLIIDYDKSRFLSRVSSAEYYSRMAVPVQSEHGRIIRRLIPLSTLPSNIFATLCKQLTVETAEPGKILFKRGDNDNRLYYLLDGEISLQTDVFKVDSIKSGSDSARFAIAHQVPRKIDAVAHSKIQYLCLDATIINSIEEAVNKEKERLMNIEEQEENSTGDWMTSLIRSPIFRNLPPANLQKMLMSLQEVSYPEGATIIKQGDEGDYYYIIKKGQAAISRRPSANAKEIRLNQLGDLDTFGEDSLISGEPRNVTITALTDVTLLRLAKQQFLTLIKEPIMKYVDYAEMQEYLKKGADLIDVRGPDEFKHQHLPGSINVPIFSLRMYLKTLNRQHPIIVACNDGRGSENAAFILLRNKFTAMILKGGLNGLREEQLQTPASFSIDDGVETANYNHASMTVDTSEADSNPSTGTVLALDQADLRTLVQKLKLKCKELEAENLALELKSSTLTRQLQAAMMELQKLKGGGQ